MLLKEKYFLDYIRLIQNFPWKQASANTFKSRLSMLISQTQTSFENARFS